MKRMLSLGGRTMGDFNIICVYLCFLIFYSMQYCKNIVHLLSSVVAGGLCGWI